MVGRERREDAVMGTEKVGRETEVVLKDRDGRCRNAMAFFLSFSGTVQAKVK